MGRQNKEKKTHFLCTRGLGLNHAVPTSMHTPAFNWWLKQVELLHTPACQHQCSHQLFLPFCPRHQPLNLSSVSSSMTAGHFKEIRILATALEQAAAAKRVHQDESDASSESRRTSRSQERFDVPSLSSHHAPQRIHSRQHEKRIFCSSRRQNSTRMRHTVKEGRGRIKTLE